MLENNSLGSSPVKKPLAHRKLQVKQVNPIKSTAGSGEWEGRRQLMRLAEGEGDGSPGFVGRKTRSGVIGREETMLIEGNSLRLFSPGKKVKDTRTTLFSCECLVQKREGKEKKPCLANLGPELEPGRKDTGRSPPCHVRCQGRRWQAFISSWKIILWRICLPLNKPESSFLIA